MSFDENGDLQWENKSKYDQYGLQSGLAGILSFLVDTYQLDIYNAVVERLLRSILTHFTKQKDDIIAAYAKDWSWNSGIIGMSIALYKAAQALNCSQTLSIANDLSQSIDCNPESLSNKTIDGLQYGKIGYAHLFSRLYYYTQNEKYKQYSQLCYSHTLNVENKEGLVGFWFPNKEYSLGVLSGIAGIGLSLIASISEHEPSWDKGLLIS